MDLEKLLTVIIGGLFGLVPVMLQWFSTKSEDRHQIAQIKRLKDEIEVVEKLASLVKLSPPERPAAPYPEIYQDLQQSIADLTKHYRNITQKARTGTETTVVNSLTEFHPLRRWFLMYKPLSNLGWLFQTIFYVLVFIGLAFFVSEFLEQQIDPSTGKPYGWGVAILGTSFFIIPALVFRWLSIKIYNKSLLKISSENSTT